jgi:hypothetical protein
LLPLLKWGGVWDLRKPHYGSHAHDPKLPSNGNGDQETMKALRFKSNGCVLFYLSKRCITCIYHNIIAINVNFIVYGFTRSGLKPTIHRTWGEYASHYITHEGKFTKGKSTDVNGIIMTLPHRQYILIRMNTRRIYRRCHLSR